MMESNAFRRVLDGITIEKGKSEEKRQKKPKQNCLLQNNIYFE